MRRLLRRNGPVTLFKEFHGRYPVDGGVKSFHVPKSLIHLGRCVGVIYETDKLNGGGDGKSAHYIHEFETPTGLFMDETGKKQLYIVGNALKVTSAGVEN